MKLRVVIGLLLAGAPTASAMAMPVSTFLAKAEGLQRKGPMAMFSSDLKLLMRQIKADSAQLKAANKAAAAAGRAIAYCTPKSGVKLSSQDMLVAMQEVPAANRATTSTRDALRAYLVRRYPCRA